MANSTNDSTSFMRRITAWILGVFSGLLLTFCVIGAVFDYSAKQNASKWFDLAENGFTSLGTAFTLVLGYYFGQKQVAKEAAQDAEKEKEAFINQVQQTLATPDQPEDRSRAPKVQRDRPSGK